MEREKVVKQLQTTCKRDEKRLTLSSGNEFGARWTRIVAAYHRQSTDNGKMKEQRSSVHGNSQDTDQSAPFGPGQETEGPRCVKGEKEKVGTHLEDLNLLVLAEEELRALLPVG